MAANPERVYKMSFASVYPHYIKKVENKGRTQAELEDIILWLLGFNREELQKHLDLKTDFKTLFEKATLHPNASKITGVICGYRIEDIEDPIIQKVRYLDKIVDELAKGKSIEKIKRKDK